MTKSLILFILLFSFGITVKAQVWIDSGAVWHYDYSDSPTIGFLKYQYTKDTVILGRTCQKIESVEHRFVSFGQYALLYAGAIPRSTNYTYVDGDTVFYYRYNQFYQLFNFGATVGDTWIISVDYPVDPNATDTAEVIVTGVDSIFINNEYYRTIELGMNTCSELHFSGQFVERFGLIGNSASNLFPISTYYPCPFDSTVFFHPIDYTLKCFEDQTFDLYNSSGEDCEYLLSILGLETYSSLEWQLYPNPANDQVQITGTNITNKDLIIFDILGQLVAKVTMTSNQFILALNGFESGIYFLKLADSDHIQKIVID